MRADIEYVDKSECMLPPINLVGYRFNPMTKEQLLNWLFLRREAGQKSVLASANLHGLYMHERHDAYRALHKRSETTVIVDGMPIIWLLRLFGFDVTRDHRTTWGDWFEAALARAAGQGQRVFILGHDYITLDRGLRRARSRWPTLQIAGRNGFFDITYSGACCRVVEEINAFSPDILFVGMGMPKQEIFANDHIESLNVPVIGLGGAAFAYFAGDQILPPRWLGRWGLEWAYRLSTNPARLSYRYFAEPILLAVVLGHRVGRQMLTRRTAMQP